MRPLRGRQSYFAKLHILAQPRNRATLRGKDREFPAEDTLLKSWEPMTFVDENQESFVRLLMGEHCRESWWSWQRSNDAGQAPAIVLGYCILVNTNTPLDFSNRNSSRTLEVNAPVIGWRLGKSRYS